MKIILCAVAALSFAAPMAGFGGELENGAWKADAVLADAYKVLQLQAQSSLAEPEDDAPGIRSQGEEPISPWQNAVDKCAVRAPAANAWEFAWKYEACFPRHIFKYLLSNDVALTPLPEPPMQPPYRCSRKTERFTGVIKVPGLGGLVTTVRFWEQYWIEEPWNCRGRGGRGRR